MSEYVHFCLDLTIGSTIVAHDVEGDARICSGFPRNWEIRLFGAGGDQTKWSSLDDANDEFVCGLRNRVITFLLARKRDELEEAKRSYYRGMAYGQGAGKRQAGTPLLRATD